MSSAVARLVHLPRKNHFFVLFAASFLFFVTPAALAAPTGSQSVPNLLAAVNATRAAHGLQPLHLDSALQSAARSHSTDMLRRDYFAHGNFALRMVAFHVHGPTAGGRIVRPSEQVGEDHHLHAHRQGVVERVLVRGPLKYRQPGDHIAVVENPEPRPQNRVEKQGPAHADDQAKRILTDAEARAKERQ